jgi:hypothetical protein
VREKRHRCTSLYGLLLIVVASGLNACCEGGFEEIFHDDFESQCGNLPCGWSFEGGMASRVETFHAGEHGLLLCDGAIARRRVAVSFFSEGKMSALGLHLAVQCDAQTGLGLLLNRQQMGLTDRLTGAVNPGTGSQERILTGSSYSLTKGDLDCSPTAPLCLVDEIVLEVKGPGQCLIDALRILNGYHSHQCDG